MTNFTSFFAVTVKGVNKLQANNPAGSRSTRPTRESEVKFVINLFLFVAAKVGSPDYWLAAYLPLLP